MPTWALEDTNKLILHFRDYNGSHAVMNFNISTSETDPLSGGAANISDAASACSNSLLYETEIQIVAVNTDAPSFGTTPYSSPGDKAFLTLTAADGTRPKLQIGAPLENVFGTDHITVDASATLVAAALTALQDNAVSDGGFAITGLARGKRRMPPRLKNH